MPRFRSRKILAASFVTLSLLVAGILTEGLLVKLPSVPKGENARERIGVVHVHTIASDGSGTVNDVMEAAEHANLSFVAITDHNVAMTTEELALDPPDLPIISGEEIGTTSGHFLALGLPPSWEHPKTTNDRELLAAAGAVGAFRVLAHPFHPHTPWTDWGTSDFDGMEIWNEDAAWRQNNIFDLLDALLLYPVNNQLALVRLASTPEENLAKWDQILQQRPLAGLCAADAHARIRLAFGKDWRFPGYVPSLSVAREHVLLAANAGGGNPALASSAELLDALRNGHSFCGLDSLHSSEGFSFHLTSGTGTAGPGDVVHCNGNGHIHVSVPASASTPLIKLYHNGREIDEQQAQSLDQAATSPGNYRAEVYLRQPGPSGFGRWTLWIFTNPIYVAP